MCPNRDRDKTLNAAYLTNMKTSLAPLLRPNLNRLSNFKLRRLLSKCLFQTFHSLHICKFCGDFLKKRWHIGIFGSFLAERLRQVLHKIYSRSDHRFSTNSLSFQLAVVCSSQKYNSRTQKGNR